MKSLKTLGIICSVSSLCIVLALILNISVIVQFILLGVGLVAGIIGLIGLTRLLLTS